MGLGFNGGQMIALAIGGCLCNDLRYVAHDMGIDITSLEVDTTVELEGDPLLVVLARVDVRLATSDPAADIAELMRRAEAGSTIGNSVARGFPVIVSRA